MRERRRGLSTPLRLADADCPGKASTARSSQLPSSSELSVEISIPSPATAEWWFVGVPAISRTPLHVSRRSTAQAADGESAAQLGVGEAARVLELTDAADETEQRVSRQR